MHYTPPLSIKRKEKRKQQQTTTTVIHNRHSIYVLHKEGDRDSSWLQIKSDRGNTDEGPTLGTHASLTFSLHFYYWPCKHWFVTQWRTQHNLCVLQTTLSSCLNCFGWIASRFFTLLHLTSFYLPFAYTLNLKRLDPSTRYPNLSTMSPPPGHNVPPPRSESQITWPQSQLASKWGQNGDFLFLTDLQSRKSEHIYKTNH